LNTEHIRCLTANEINEVSGARSWDLVNFFGFTLSVYQSDDGKTTCAGIIHNASGDGVGECTTTLP
jgi:hypothetical protein